MKRRPFRRVAEQLSSTPPLLFLLCYVILIPCFALIYIFIPDHSFYAPYVRHESTTIDDRGLLRELVGTAVRRQVDRQGADSPVTVAGSQLTEIVVDDVDSDDGSRITIVMLGRFGPAPKGEFNVVLRLMMERWNSETATGPNGTSHYHLLESLDKDGTIQHTLFTQAFPRFAASISDPERAFLELNDTEHEQVERFVSGVQADPTLAPGAFWRMLYFSAVVVTTVGFGDIVPVAPAARFFTALEAVLGILLAGLFLNSIAYRASHRSRLTEESE
jgi:hypothetical protein